MTPFLLKSQDVISHQKKKNRTEKEKKRKRERNIKRQEDFKI